MRYWVKWKCATAWNVIPREMSQCVECATAWHMLLREYERLVRTGGSRDQCGAAFLGCSRRRPGEGSVIGLFEKVDRRQRRKPREREPFGVSAGHLDGRGRAVAAGRATVVSQRQRLVTVVMVVVMSQIQALDVFESPEVDPLRDQNGVEEQRAHGADEVAQLVLPEKPSGLAAGQRVVAEQDGCRVENVAKKRKGDELHGDAMGRL